MQYLGLLIIIYAIHAAQTDVPNKDFVDPNDLEDKAFMWENLFIKINTILTETDKLNRNLLDLNKRFQDLSKRLDDQESHLAKLRESVHDFGKRLDIQDIELKRSLNYSQKWTTILRRQDGSENFYRNWNEYGNGFGNPNGEFFIGLQKLHDLTTYGPPHELMIVLKNFDGETRYAHYDAFRIDSEAQKYALLVVGAYSGNAGDCLTSHRGHKFTTYDQDNDNNDSRNCAVTFHGAWWFYGLCYAGHLNGPYRSDKEWMNWGVSWNTFSEWNRSLKYAEMLIRPKIY